MVGKARISVSTLLIILAVSTFAVLIPLRERFLPKGELTVWVGLERPEIGPIEEIAREFERTYQTTVKVVWISDIKSLRARYRVGVPAGAAADVIVGPHDWIGEFVEMGVVADVTDNFRENERGEFLPIALESVRMGNRFWGFPVLLESLVLIYNKSFVSRAPENWEDLIAKALELQREDFHGFYYPHVDPYYSFPILSGYGAYIFGDENVENIGLATEGAILGARFIQDLVHKFHVLPLDTTLNPYVVRDTFIAGRAAMIIDGPWAFGRFREAGINYGVSPLPPLPNGQYPRTFVGVQVSMVNPRSKKLELAVNFAKHLASPESQLKLHRAGWRLPTRTKILAMVENEPEVRVVKEQAENGVLIPKTAAMESVWGPWTDALRLIVSGLDPAEKLKEAVSAIQKAIKRRMK